MVVSEHPQTTKTKNDSQRALGETTVGKPLGAVDKITRNDEQHIGGYQGGRLSNQRGNTKYAGSKNKNFGQQNEPVLLLVAPVRRVRVQGNRAGAVNVHESQLAIGFATWD